MSELTQAARDVLAERARQINVEGWTPEHDDEHGNNEMARAAYCYVGHYYQRGWTAPDVYAAEEASVDWPWSEKWWRPKNPRRDLVRAAALILAEIERLDRAAGKAGVTEGHGKTFSQNPPIPSPSVGQREQERGGE